MIFFCIIFNFYFLLLLIDRIIFSFYIIDHFYKTLISKDLKIYLSNYLNFYWHKPYFGWHPVPQCLLDVPQ